MFQALESFREQVKSLQITISFAAGGKQFVMVTPVVAEDTKTKSPELAQPFSLTASAVDLDAQFAAAIGMLAGARKSIADQAAAQAAALKTKPAKGGAAPKVDIVSDDDLEPVTVAKPTLAPAAALQAESTITPLTAQNLFDSE